MYFQSVPEGVPVTVDMPELQIGVTTDDVPTEEEVDSLSEALASLGWASLGWAS